MVHARLQNQPMQLTQVSGSGQGHTRISVKRSILQAEQSRIHEKRRGGGGGRASGRKSGRKSGGKGGRKSGRRALTGDCRSVHHLQAALSGQLSFAAQSCRLAARAALTDWKSNFPICSDTCSRLCHSGCWRGTRTKPKGRPGPRNGPRGSRAQGHVIGRFLATDVQALLRKGSLKKRPVLTLGN